MTFDESQQPPPNIAAPPVVELVEVPERELRVRARGRHVQRAGAAIGVQLRLGLRLGLGLAAASTAAHHWRSPHHH